jgi:hypothetical protein
MEEGQWKGSTHQRRTCPTLPERQGVERGRDERVEGREGARGGREGRLEAPVTAQRLGSPRREVWGHKPAAGLLQDVGSKAEGGEIWKLGEALQGRD